MQVAPEKLEQAIKKFKRAYHLAKGMLEEGATNRQALRQFEESPKDSMGNPC
ncbi:hypothetical protein [Helicobacter sp. L8]|uniref:hypothetical protein n=1 Tax=Helicobacter sp. L8 TaxID=2316078 RepID=UPI0013CDEDF6|nr:hypothetical protein [Helicobacter sp. L8]